MNNWLTVTRILGIYRATQGFIVRVLRGIVWPYLDVAVRLLIAKAFMGFGIGPLVILGAALLAVGLATRYAALLLSVLAWAALVRQAPASIVLYWSALLGWYVVNGAAPLSLDGLFRRGLRESALPLIARIMRASETLRIKFGPFYLSALRIGIAAALLGGRLPEPQTLGLIGGAILFVGFATRYTAGVLLLSFSANAMMHADMAAQIYPLTMLLLFALHGGGWLSFDTLAERQLIKRLPELDGRPTFSLAGVPRVVIVGAGFGGIACAFGLLNLRASITLIDRANHHLFQPLLYQVATAALSPGDIASPVRPLFRQSFNTCVLFGAVDAVDTERRTVSLAGKCIPYDYLVLATGAAHSYFGKDHWAPHAPGLKRIEDATEIRRRILTAFERAEATDDPEELRALLTFLIVGGGPTGVELAGAIAELAHFGMDKDFRNFDPATARIILVQSAPRLLPAFPPTLAARAQRSLEKLGVEVMLGGRVEAIDALGATVGTRRIASRTVLWAAGVKASPAASWLKADADGSGRIKVAEDLSLPTLPDVFAIGDTAASSAWCGNAVPGLAPAAKQGGAYVAAVIRARVEGRKKPPKAFQYRHRGSLATIGRQAAVADFGRIRLWGAPAWWLWGIVHVGFLVGVRSRVSTMLNWFWAYLAYSGGIRLITGEEQNAVPKS